MVKSVVTCVSSAALLLVVVVVGWSAGASIALVEPTWNCVDIPAQTNVTMQQILGKWYLWSTYHSSRNDTISGCFTFSMTELQVDNNKNRSLLAVNICKSAHFAPDYVCLNISAYVFKDKPGDIIFPVFNVVWRVQSVDERDIVFAGCFVQNRILFWLTLGDAEDSHTMEVPQGYFPNYRRDNNDCPQPAPPAALPQLTSTVTETTRPDEVTTETTYSDEVTEQFFGW